MATDQLIGKLPPRPAADWACHEILAQVFQKQVERMRLAPADGRLPIRRLAFCPCSIERVANYPTEDGLQLRRGRIVWMPCVQEQDGHLS